MVEPAVTVLLLSSFKFLMLVDVVVVVGGVTKTQVVSLSICQRVIAPITPDHTVPRRTRATNPGLQVPPDSSTNVLPPLSLVLRPPRPCARLS